MTSPTRLLPVLSALAGVLLIAGCASSSPGSTTPSSSPAPSSSSSGGDDADLDGTLLDDGRMFAVITQGSSSLACTPQITQVTAKGQVVDVTVEDKTDPAVMCTADYAPRASIGALPEGVDPTKEITLNVTYGEVVDDVDLDGDPAFTGKPGSSTDYLPSAGWIDDGSLVLLTWGSSTCPPVVESVEGAGATGTATFVTDDGEVCTMDMAPRGTIIAFADDQVDDDDGFTLTLVGGGLDGTVDVRG
ncbi:hypothetical protein ACI3KT_18120 [Microbacterium sp. ZW T6_19]|uniref:hypothetical protein n=1 Tax=Microbacterium sp. ZW T6_19 TaxID=3378082 RepID=UPI0038535872